jgi:3-phytase
VSHVATFTILAALACGGAGDEGGARVPASAEAAPTDDARQVPVIAETWQTPRDTVDNIDSPAVWHGPGGEHWLLATAKETDVIVLSDASTGEVIRRVGGSGSDPGQMDRPNGIAVMDDLMFVVERDNARVQVFTLPDLAPLGTYGDGDLLLPYGIAVVAEAAGVYSTYITDNYELMADVVPPDSLLDERVRHYRVTVTERSVDAELVGAFGDTEGDGVLRVVESIAADRVHERLLVAEEQEGASMIKAYTLEGRFRDEVIPEQFFPHQAEGIVLYACGDDGYWVATDQGEEVNTFHVFDRVTLDHLGSFRGRRVLNTDGVALTQVAFPGFPAGAFFAVHDDGSVAAFNWEEVARPLGLRSDCVRPGRS